MPYRAGATTRQAQSAFSFVELMMVLAVIGIIGALAYPSYVDYIRKSKRTVAKSALLEVAARQEAYYFDNRQYTSDLTLLNYPSSPAEFGSNGQALSPGGGAVYTVAAQVDVSGCGGAPCFVLTATPQGDQAADTACGSYVLHSDGSRAPATAGCW